MGARSPGAVAIGLLLALAVPAAGEPAASTAGAWSLAAPAPVFGAPSARPGPASGSAFASPSALVDDGGLLAARGMGTRTDKPKQPKEAPAPKPGEPGAAKADSLAPTRHRAALPRVLSGQRARIMLQSLTVPGWGEATLGQKRSALAFGLLEAGIWGSFTAFRIQERMRRETYQRTASLYAGIDLSHRDEEYRRVVGFYISSDEYNQLVVRRNAANLYFGDPAAYDAYIAEHELKGADTWAWDSDESQLRYRTERKRTERAALRANAALGVAIANRILSAIHVARYAGHPTTTSQSWNLECVPVLGDPVAFHLGVRTRF